LPAITARCLEPRPRSGGKRRHVWPSAGSRGDKAYDQVASALIVARDHQGRSAFGVRKICERKASEDDAAKGEHLTCSLYQVSVGVEFELVRKPVERATCLGDRCRRQLLGIPDLDQHMHPGVGGNAAAD
jgi:hypothetical protein